MDRTSGFRGTVDSREFHEKTASSDPAVDIAARYNSWDERMEHNGSRRGTHEL